MIRYTKATLSFSKSMSIIIGKISGPNLFILKCSNHYVGWSMDSNLILLHSSQMREFSPA
jgi:hypothetical protein